SPLFHVAFEVREQGKPPPMMGVHLVDNSFFGAVGARRVSGRFFGPEDRGGTQPVAVLSQGAAEATFPGEEAVGRRFHIFGNSVEIVGVVEDFRQAGRHPSPQRSLYLPFRQVPDSVVSVLRLSPHLLIRTASSPRERLPAIRTRLQQLAPEVPTIAVRTVREVLDESVTEPRFFASLATAFAALALLLAAVGIYGVLSYSVQQRLQEIAIRCALGARPGQVLLGVVLRGLTPVVSGLFIGLAAATALTRLLEAMLYGIEPTDPATYAIVAGVFLVVSFVAVWFPARRATRIDPMRVLRHEA
ncbi:MAG: FtsX-like permease family protein, partial [Acidobacteriota bacterium]